MSVELEGWQSRSGDRLEVTGEVETPRGSDFSLWHLAHLSFLLRSCLHPLGRWKVMNSTLGEKVVLLLPSNETGRSKVFKLELKPAASPSFSSLRAPAALGERMGSVAARHREDHGR